MSLHYIKIDRFDPEQPFIYQGICFDPQHGSGSVGNTAEVNYMGHVIFISPETFLEAAAHLEKGEERDSLTFFEKNLPDGKWCIGPSMLYLDQKDGRWIVVGHEGRHRAMACAKLGLKLIPVYIFGVKSKNLTTDILTAMRGVTNQDRKARVILGPSYVIWNRDVYAVAHESRSPEHYTTEGLIERLRQKWQQIKPRPIQTVRQKTDEYYWSVPARNPNVPDRFIEQCEICGDAVTFKRPPRSGKYICKKCRSGGWTSQDIVKGQVISPEALARREAAKKKVQGHWVEETVTCPDCKGSKFTVGQDGKKRSCFNCEGQGVRKEKRWIKTNPLSDSRRLYLQKEWARNTKEPLTEEILKSIGEADPTATGEYSPWILKLWRKKTIRLPEDTDKLREELENFHKVKRYLPATNRDVNRLASYAELRQLLAKHPNLISKRQAAQLAEHQGQRIIGKDGLLTLLEVTTPEAAHELAQGSGWCVKDPRHSKDYLKQGPLYFIHKEVPIYTYICKFCKHQSYSEEDPMSEYEFETSGGGKCYQCARDIKWELVKEDRPYVLAHIPSKQVMDTDDDPVSEEVEAEILPLIKKYIPGMLCQNHGEYKQGLPIRKCLAYARQPSFCNNQNTCKGCMSECSDKECNEDICYECGKRCQICEQDFCEKHTDTCMECKNLICHGDSIVCYTFSKGKRQEKRACEDCAPKCDNCHERFCPETEAAVTVAQCETCEKTYCENCGGTRQCAGCQSSVCNSDSITCSICDEAVCKDCRRKCSQCRDEVCSTCSDECKGCQQVICENCSEDGLCEDCREDDEDENEEQMEDEEALAQNPYHNFKYEYPRAKMCNRCGLLLQADNDKLCDRCEFEFLEHLDRPSDWEREHGYRNNPMTLREKIAQLEQRIENTYPVTLGLSLRGGDEYLHVDTIEVQKEQRGKGIGSTIMEILTDFADDHGLSMALSPTSTKSGKASPRLVDFYRRFGFVRNKGRHKDFRVMASMIRP